jgi:hypothetical protein
MGYNGFPLQSAEKDVSEYTHEQASAQHACEQEITDAHAPRQVPHLVRQRSAHRLYLGRCLGRPCRVDPV